MCLGHLHGWQHKAQMPTLDYLGFSGECITSSVVSHRSKNLKWWTGVTSLLQLSFIPQAKESIPSRHKGRLTPKEGPQSVLASSFYVFVSSPP